MFDGSRGSSVPGACQPDAKRSSIVIPTRTAAASCGIDISIWCRVSSSVMVCLEWYAKYNPGFVVIDTPLLGLDQGVNDAAPESMRTALFKYFISHQSDGQIIILENMMHIPVLDYEGAGANVITFTKGLEVGRYGFLNDVK